MSKALHVAKEALERVHKLETTNLFLLVVVVLSLGYVLYINLYVEPHHDERAKIMAFYNHAYARSILIGLLLLGMSGIMGPTMRTSSVMLAFVFVSTYITLRHLSTENFTPKYPISHDDPLCVPCKGKGMFNPRPYKPDSNIQGIGNDKLPPTGVDFLSDPPGVYSQSQISYQLGMR